MEFKIDKYEDIYQKLKRCFDVSFGNDKLPALISMKNVKHLIDLRGKPDFKNNLPQNSLMETPENLYEELKETYIGRTPEYVSGTIGCTETPIEQMDGITNMTLLMYMSNHLSKEYKNKLQNETNPDRIKLIKKNVRTLLNWKDISLTDLIASTYVLSKTSEDYKDYFSYGKRVDDENKSTFVMDLPYIGQLCVHFGWDENEKMIVERAEDSIKAILEKKLELGQITESQSQEILKDLEENSALPEYEGKLYEYVGAFPIEYEGKNMMEKEKLIGRKNPEDLTKEDIAKLELNERELYYFLIKIGAPKEKLYELSGIKQMKKDNNNKETTTIISPEMIEKATENLTISEINNGITNIEKLVNEEKIKKDSITRD